MSKSEARSLPKLRRTSPRRSNAPGSGVQRRSKAKRLPETHNRVLLMVADATVADEYGRLLATCCVPEIVSSGAAALEVLLVDTSIQLVVCAAETADMSACEFLQNLSWVVPGEHPPVLVIGQTSGAEAARAIKLGAARCLPATASQHRVAREVELLLGLESMKIPLEQNHAPNRTRRAGGSQ